MSRPVIQQATYWNVIINNPNESDWVIVRNPNEKYIRGVVWTREIGEEGTEHVQAWCRLFRNGTLALMKKLYPRAHMKIITKDEYNERSHDYAQKEDATTAGNHHIYNNELPPDARRLLYLVIEKAIDEFYFQCRVQIPYHRQDAYTRGEFYRHHRDLEEFVREVKRRKREAEDTLIYMHDTSDYISGLCSPVYDRMFDRFVHVLVKRFTDRERRRIWDDEEEHSVSYVEHHGENNVAEET